MRESNSNPDFALGQLQRWMQAVITDPDGVESGLSAVPAQQEIPLRLEQLEDVILPSQRQSSLNRLEIYANAYYARLLECLRDEFPATVRFLGESVFDAFAFDYLQQYPSRSYTLAMLGAHFPDYLRETSPRRDDQPGSLGDPQWEDFVIELVSLERAYSEIFTGPGLETSSSLRSEDIAAIPEDRIEDLVFVPAPCLRMMSFQFPVHEYISAIRSQREVSPPEPQPTWLVMTRRDYVVRRASVSSLEYELLACLVAGTSLGAAIQQVLASVSESEEHLISLLQEWFQRWAASKYFLEIKLPDQADQH